jgi:hypothetical protein
VEQELKIQVFYPYDQDEAIIEFWFGDTLWASTVEKDEPLLEIFPNPNGDSWVFSLDQVATLLDQARQQLIEWRSSRRSQE